MVRHPWIARVVLTGAVAAFVAFGIVGVGREPRPGPLPDFSYFYTAGKCWLQGKSPYDMKVLTEVGRGSTDVGEVGFAYPPQSSLPFGLLALLPLGVANVFWIVLGAAAVGAVAWLCARPLYDCGPPGAEPCAADRLLIAAVVVGNPFPAHALWMGGSSLLMAAVLIGCWVLAERRRWLPAGILLGIATCKPQFAMLPVLWFLLERRWKLLATGFVVALLMSIPAFASAGVVGAYRDWGSALTYAAGRSGLDSYWSEMGLARFAQSVGIPLPSLMACAPLGVVALWIARSRIAPGDRYPLLLGIAFQFIYLHDGDLPVLSPIVPAVFHHARTRGGGLVAIVLAAVLMFPQRALRSPHFEALGFVRIPALALMLGGLLVLSLRETAERPHPHSP